MTLRVFIHSRSKRAEAVALLDSGATENFMNIKYAQKTGLPIQRLTEERSSSMSMGPRTKQDH
jgi:hypothetical protein